VVPINVGVTEVILMYFSTLHWWIRVWTLQRYTFKARHFVYNHKGAYRVICVCYSNGIFYLWPLWGIVEKK